MLDYRIDTFLTLYEQMNYRKTAELLNMTQPGVTQHIHYLETFYGVKLFEYNGRKLTRTRQAEQLKRHFDSVRSEEISLIEGFVQTDTVHLKVGATKTIGEYVIVPTVRAFLSQERHSLDLVVDNTENLLAMLSHGELDFAVIEGIFDKRQYPHHLFKKEHFLGICGKDHSFADKTISLEDVFRESLIVREQGSGTRRLLEQAIADRGYSLGSFRRCSSIGNFSVICELVAINNAITFAYEPIAHCRNDLATFMVEDMQIQGEFNFVYTNTQVAQSKIAYFTHFSN
ncbi:MAG: LysR family transcriptional regulator [Oscillospiraceae bacterium]|nr:LysR family transcriptional regulator [Oscillospiraceae bacterium]